MKPIEFNVSIHELLSLTNGKEDIKLSVIKKGNYYILRVADDTDEVTISTNIHQLHVPS